MKKSTPITWKDNFEIALDDLYFMHHYHQSSVPRNQMTEAEKAELAKNDQMARGLDHGTTRNDPGFLACEGVYQNAPQKGH